MTSVVDFFSSIIDLGGAVVMILIIMSIFSLAVVFYKVWQFRPLFPFPQEKVRSIINRHRSGLECVKQNSKATPQHPVLSLIEIAIRAKEFHTGPIEEVREEISRLAQEKIESLRNYFKLLEVVAAVSPLLGLFGTVLGMIDAFRSLADAGSQVDPGILSGGIWVALLTTAVGLGVAIPVMVVLNFLERIVERTTQQMENYLTQVFTPDLSAFKE